MLNMAVPVSAFDIIGIDPSFMLGIMNSSKSSGAGSLNSKVVLWRPQYPPGGKHDNNNSIFSVSSESG